MPNIPNPLQEIGPPFDADYAMFSDGARVAWLNGAMLCTCVTAKAQQQIKNCCKHIAWIIREHRDYVKPERSIWVPMVLPDSDDAVKNVSWVRICIDIDNLLWATLKNQNDDREDACIGTVGDPVSRLEVRNMIVPHILGLAHRIHCKKCADGTPIIIQRLMENRENQVIQLKILPEVVHWLDTDNDLCREHDDSDLVPF